MSEHYTPHHAPRRPEGLPVRLLLLASCVAVGLVAFVLLVAMLGARLDPLDRAARVEQQYRDLEIAGRLEWLDVLLAGAWRALPLLLVAAGAAVALGIAWRRWGSQDAVRAHYVIQAARAQHGPVPASLTYSPHYAPHLSNRQEGLALPEPDAPMLADVPTFAQLLDRGKLGVGRPLVLGYDVATGQELTGSWLDLYSTAVSGMPGSGKTTSQRFLACQTALQGAQFAVCDPHAEAGDDSLAATLAPLSAAFIAAPASSDKAILDVVRYVADVGRRRVEGKDSSTTPLILWLDELTSLLGRSSVAEPLAELLERIAQEYRKKQVFACASGQIWTAARTSSELRDSFASVLCHRMKRAQARLLLPTDEAETVERLEIGRAGRTKPRRSSGSRSGARSCGAPAARRRLSRYPTPAPTMCGAWARCSTGRLPRGYLSGHRVAILKPC